jgi:hypothetical protein
VDELLAVAECLSKAQEYISLAQATSDATLRRQYLLITKELIEIAAKLDGAATPKPA